MIKCRRKLLKISQKELASKLEISKSYMNLIENHKFTNITVNLLDHIAFELKLDKHELLDWLLNSNNNH